ncbi:hypothetical protein [Acidocella sp.]|uniref:hypothetical protein n=1 Tax=Acidocella sp. TaxID=50710 RepID=UPI003CFFA1E7
MSISAEEFEVIDQMLKQSAGMAALREALPHLRWHSCDAADVTEEPFRSYPGLELYFLDCSNHCVQVVGAAEQASGLLLAMRKGA